MEESVRRSSTISERGKFEISVGQHCYRLAQTRKEVCIHSGKSIVLVLMILGWGGGGSGCPCGSSENDCIGHVSCLLIKKALS